MRLRRVHAGVWAAALCAVSIASVSRADDSVAQPTRAADGSEATKDPTVPATDAADDATFAAPTASPRAPAPQLRDAELAPSHTASRSRGAYPYVLLAGYLALPAFVTTLAIAQPDIAGEAIFLGVFAGFLLPPAIHLAYGSMQRAGHALLGWPGVTLGCGMLGLAIGFLVGPDDEDGNVSRLLSAFAGATVGAIIGATIWPIYDLADVFDRNAARRPSASARQRAALRIAVAPDPRGGLLGVLQGSFAGL